MFRPLYGHHQACFGTSRQYVAYIVGIPTIFIKYADILYM